MKVLAILSVAMLLSGCCSLCPDKIKEVYIKTGCSPPPVVTAPVLKTNAITSTSSQKETVEAYVFDTLALKTYVGQLESALTPYRSCQPTVGPSQGKEK